MNTLTTLSMINKLWKSEAGYTITLRCNGRRSRVDVRDDEGRSVIFHEFEYYQQARAEQEAEALALLAHAVEVPVAIAPAA